MEGHELAYISERIFSLNKRYRIYRPDGSFARITKHITLFKERYRIDVPEGPGYDVRGDFWGLDYGFYRGERLAAVVSRKLISWTDSYAIRVVPDEDDILILAAAVVIDMVKKDRNRADAGPPQAESLQKSSGL